MKIETVTLFGASGRQGQAQLRELLRQGYSVRAVTRQKDILTTEGHDGMAVMPADFSDPASLDRVLHKADAAFFQLPLVELPERLLLFARNVGEAARRAQVQRLIVNSTMWAPDEPCGVAMYDQVLQIENVIASFNLPTVVFRPTFFMDNWLTAFAKPAIIHERKYRYPHHPALRVSPISLADLAQFMVKALQHEELVGQRLRLAGPETFTPPEVARVLSAVMGAKIEHEYMQPRDFANYACDLFDIPAGPEREGNVAHYTEFYSFNNTSAQEPFYYDMAALLKRFPVRLERLQEWAHRQDWTTLNDATGSASR